MEERRTDYISLPELLKEGTNNSSDIKHMKDTLDKHGDKLDEQGDKIDDMASDIKAILYTTNTEIRILKIQVKWILAAIFAFFSGLATIGTMYGKSILAFLATIIR